MSEIDKSLGPLTDISLDALLERAALAPDLPLVFFYDGRPIRAGYHVTEVKAGQFSALDCGANPESWAEIFVQLWDIDESGRSHMPAGKFAAIVRKVSEHVALGGSAKLTFEVSDGIRPMELFCAGAPVELDGALHVDLSPRPASCKPRDRWLAKQQPVMQNCCGSSQPEPCCA